MVIIKLIQETLNKSQQIIADEIGVSRQTISMWLSGYKISNKYLLRINEVYGIPLYYLKSSQVTGFSYTNEDISNIKKILLKENIDNNNVLIKRLLGILLYENILVKNIDENVIKHFNSLSIKFDKYSTLMNLNSENKYLFLIEIYSKELLDIVLFLDDIKKKFDLGNINYIIYKGKMDNIEFLTFGDYNGTTN